jgi:hypothetical protein
MPGIDGRLGMADVRDLEPVERDKQLAYWNHLARGLAATEVPIG